MQKQNSSAKQRPAGYGHQTYQGQSAALAKPDRALSLHTALVLFQAVLPEQIVAVKPPLMRTQLSLGGSNNISRAEERPFYVAEVHIEATSMVYKTRHTRSSRSQRRGKDAGLHCVLLPLE